jgi:thiol-disulfide isomerase/thioredoxin
VPDSPLRFGYRRTLECASVLKRVGDKVVAKYCRARWCPVCSAIRTSKLTVAYGPELATWTAPYFVTLSRPNVKAANLNGEIRSIQKAFVLLAKNVRRTDGIALRAVRKIEVTYNQQTKSYHPHFHILVDSKAAAEALYARWLAVNPTASPKAQDCRPATGWAECLKYCTKLLVKGLDGKTTTPPAHALDAIFKALKGLRTVQPMGFKVPALAVVADDEALQLDASTPAPDFSSDKVEWVPWLYDWVDKATGEVIADYSPSLEWAETLSRIEHGPD